jgi:hypothetical protein
MEILEAKLADLLWWERRKRHEQTLVRVLCYALVLAILFLPLYAHLPSLWMRWVIPAVLIVALAPWFFYRARWRRADSARALAHLDHTLKLDELTVTAWELRVRSESGAAALFVLKNAQEKLRAVDGRAAVPRRWNWPAYAAAPLCALWFALVWLDFDRHNVDPTRQVGVPTLAHKLRDFSRDLQDKAKNEGLRDTLTLSRELEKTAQKNIEAKTADDAFKKELAGAAKKFAATAKASGEKNSFSTAESEQSLRDLKAELDAMRDSLQLPDGIKGTQELGQRWMERLAAMPQLRRQFEKTPRDGSGAGPNELKSFLDKLEQQVAGELDRRSLIDAQQYLEQMMKQGQGQKGENYARAQGEQGSDAEGPREKTHSNLPGKEPGKRDEENRPLPEFRAGASTQVKGSLGEGDSSALALKGNPTAGRSGLSQEEVVASYRRQAEQDLNSERVPEGLKETIKNYFLSLGEARNK